jgi:hypothetical protein
MNEKSPMRVSGPVELETRIGVFSPVELGIDKHKTYRHQPNIRAHRGEMEAKDHGVLQAFLLRAASSSPCAVSRRHIRVRIEVRQESENHETTLQKQKNNPNKVGRKRP